MQASEFVAGGELKLNQEAKPIASWGHFAGFLAIMGGICGLGFLAQQAGGAGGASSGGGQLAGHGQAIKIYLTAGFMDWALLYYCWVGVHHRGGTLETLSGGRWKSWRSVMVDLAIAAPFWVLWEGVAWGVHQLVGPSSAKTVLSLLPQSLLEIAIWIGVSITAGICEEMAFRGYLQRQFTALSGSVTVAVVAQGIVFGVAHAYQGWKNVVVIAALGILYGAMAAWRRNIRVTLIAHAWGDVWEGWLKFVVWK
jgi:membrane protease YdiL (CAAX protease family)